MYLNKEEKELISAQIEELEKSSSAELVAVFTKKSASYKYESLLVTIFLVFFFSFFLLFFSWISIFQLLEFQLLFFTALFVLFDIFENLILKILPKSYKHKKAFENAQKQFFNLGLNRTKTKQAIMFFVSFDEKYVQIISDTEISKKINDSYWQEIIDMFILDVKKNELSKGYLKAIKSCSDILIDNFPIQSDDENELSNEVIELKS